MLRIIVAGILSLTSFVFLSFLFFLKARKLKTLSVEELNKTQPSVALMVRQKVVGWGKKFFLTARKRLSPHVEIVRQVFLLALSRLLLWLVRKLSALRDNLRGRTPVTRRQSSSLFLRDLSVQAAKNNQGVIHG